MLARPLHTLTGRTLLWLALGGTLLLLLATGTGAWLLYRQGERQASEALAREATERARVAAQVFRYTLETHAAVRDAFVRQWPQYQGPEVLRRFDALMTRHRDGSLRSRPEISDGRRFPTGWVARADEADEDLRRRVVLFHDLSRRYGPGAALRRDNLYFVGLPQQSNMGYDPELFPNWVNDIGDHYDQLRWEWGRTAYEPAEPGAPARFSTPEPDDVDSRLGATFAISTPIHLGRRHVAAVCSTLLLSDVLGRVLPKAPSGRLLVVHADGRLIADTASPDPTTPSLQKARLSSVGEDLAGVVQSLALSAGDAARWGSTAGGELHVAVARIEGPPWHAAVVVPGAAVRAAAIRTAFSAFWLGGTVVLALLALVWWVLRRQVATPLGALTRAAERLSAGDTAVRLPEGRHDELGRLAHAFNEMAARVAERDAALRADKARIEQALEAARRTEEEMARQREALHQSEKLSALGTLLAGVAHELNNPLTVVVGRARQLQRGARSAADRETAERIRQAAERCARIVKTFLAMARRQTPQRVSTDLNRVVRDALDVLGYSLRSAGVEVHAELARDLPPVMADASQLGQVVMNLVTNAQQALQGHREHDRQLHVATRRAGDWLRLEVRDNGPGIPPELRTRIFEPFFTTKDVGEGTGVGLAVSLGIAHAHGGELAVEPSDQGACLVLTLPVAHDAPPAVEAPPADAPAQRPLQVLVVDDEPEIAQLLADILRSAGHRVRVAYGGEQALSMLGPPAPDVVLTDVRMPGIGGAGLYREILRRDPALARRLIAVTGDTLGRRAHGFLQESGVRVIDKPFERDEVLQAVAEAAEEGRA